MKLIKCSDYVIKKSNVAMKTNNVAGQIVKEYYEIVDYANFLKRPLELGMFIPCDKDGNVLEEPSKKGIGGGMLNLEIQYREAKERVLFKGFTAEKRRDYYIVQKLDLKNGMLDTIWISYTNRTIEDLTELGLELTEQGIKQFN